MKSKPKLNFKLLFESDTYTTMQLVKEFLHYVVQLDSGKKWTRIGLLRLLEAVVDPEAKRRLFQQNSMDWDTSDVVVLRDPDTLLGRKDPAFRELLRIHRYGTQLTIRGQPAYDYRLIQNCIVS